MSCCRICFFSAAFLRVGVELLRFFLGDGEPTCKLFSLDGEFSFGNWEDIAEHFGFVGIFFWFFVSFWFKRANREKHI
jgi:hypothetical protein